MFRSKIAIISFLVLLASFVIFCYLSFFPKHLYFVDSARYADIARNLIEQGKLIGTFAHPTGDLGNEWSANGPPVHILVIALFFKIFGVSDFSVILESTFFFIVSTALIYLLASRVFNSKVAIFSSLFYIFTPQLLNYAKDGASESIFIFELLLISYLIILGKKWSLTLAGVISAIALFTKLQAYIFIPIFILWIILLYKFKSIIYYLIGPVIAFIFSWSGLSNYKIRIPLYLAYQQSSIFPGDDITRSGSNKDISLSFLFSNLKVFLTKIFYNSFNFYKSIFVFDNTLPPLTYPFIVINFITASLVNFFTEEKKERKVFGIVVLVMVVVSILLAASTSPHIRYIHFVIPFIIIVAVDFLDRVISALRIKRSYFVFTLFLVIFFIIPFLGTTLLDSRFKASIYNLDKQYMHLVLGKKIGDETLYNASVVTNLDSWGSWYGDRRTILIPTDFKSLERLDKQIKIDAIFLTDFQKNNEDHPLTNDWGLLYDSPEKNENEFITDNFYLKKVATVSANEVYENQPITYKIWIRKK